MFRRLQHRYLRILRTSSRAFIHHAYTRTYQYSSWLDGVHLLWIGRRKQSDRGEGSSRLRFDLAEKSRESRARQSRVTLENMRTGVERIFDNS
jgi:hypothetical protein